MNRKTISLIGMWYVATSLLLAQPSVSILSPSANARWSRGGTYPIKWVAISIDTISIAYSTTGASGPWTPIISGLPTSSTGSGKYPDDEINKVTKSGSYHWRVPYSESDSSYIRISHNVNPAIFDTSSFAIVNTGVWTIQVSEVALPLYAVQPVSSSFGGLGGVAWAGGKHGLILKTYDSGTYWYAAGWLGEDVHAISAVDHNLAIAASRANDAVGRIYRTTDGGGLWSVVDMSNTIWRHIRLFNEAFNSSTGFALGDPVGGFWTLKRTTDRGSSWFDVQPRVSADANEQCRYNAMTWRDSQRGWFASTANKVYRTTDAGTTWSSVLLTLGNTTISAIHFNSNTVGLVGTENGSISRTSDGGISWTAAASVLPSGVVALSGVSSPNHCWAACGANVYFSQDSGKTWSPTNFLGYSGITSLNHLSLNGRFDAGFGWAVGDDGAIVRYQLFLTDVSERGSETLEAFRLDQNYPNPFNPTTTIRFTIPVGTYGRTSLRVFDLLGREVATLVNELKESGTHTVTWDASNQASGVYFCRLHAGQFVATKKLLLLR